MLHKLPMSREIHSIDMISLRYYDLGITSRYLIFKDDVP